jgi:hypothetical protein
LEACLRPCPRTELSVRFRIIKEQPVVAALSDTQIKRMAESYYATMLADDEEERREGTGSEPVFQKIAKQLIEARVAYETPFAIGPLPEAGLSDREIIKREETLEWLLPASTAALARGDITIMREQLDELLYAFQINLDRSKRYAPDDDGIAVSVFEFLDGNIFG